jgi:hypothetical protein
VKLSDALVLLLVTLVLIRDGRKVDSAVRDGVAAVATMTILAALAAGWLIGDPEPDYKLSWRW